MYCPSCQSSMIRGKREKEGYSYHTLKCGTCQFVIFYTPSTPLVTLTDGETV